jgi:hypothetical protein
MRRRPAEVHLCRRRTAQTLMGAEVRVVDEAHLNRRGEVLRCGWPQQAQAERVLQRPPQPSLSIKAIEPFFPTAPNLCFTPRHSSLRRKI